MTLFLARSESLGGFSLSSRETVDTELELSSVPPTSLSLVVNSPVTASPATAMVPSIVP